MGGEFPEQMAKMVIRQGHKMLSEPKTCEDTKFDSVSVKIYLNYK